MCLFQFWFPRCVCPAVGLLGCMGILFPVFFSFKNYTILISSMYMHVYLVKSNFLQPYGLQTIRLLCPWDSASKNTGVGCHFLLQGISPTQGLNPSLLCLLHWQVDSLPLCYLRNSLISISWRRRKSLNSTVAINNITVKVLVTQSRSTLWDPMDCSQPGSSVHGILQARILEW